MASPITIDLLKYLNNIIVPQLKLQEKFNITSTLNDTYITITSDTQTGLISIFKANPEILSGFKNTVLNYLKKKDNNVEDINISISGYDIIIQIIKIPETLKHCLTYEEFTTRYELIKCLSSGSYSIVVRYKERSTNINYAVKFVSLNSKEYDISLLITQHKEELINVTTVYGCVIINFYLFQEDWNKIIGKNEECSIDTYENSELFLGIIYDEIDITFGVIPKENIQPYFLFELYYVFYKLLTIGIQPDDVHADNIGIKYYHEPQKYIINNCEVILPPGNHIRLIDYGNYFLRENKPIKHINIRALFSMITTNNYINPFNDFDYTTYLCWMGLREPSTNSPEEIMTDIINNVLDPTNICLPRIVSRQWLWQKSEPMTFGLLNETQREFIKDIISDRPLNGIVNFVIDTVRSTNNMDYEDIMDKYEKLPLLTRMYYSSLHHLGKDDIEKIALSTLPLDQIEGPINIKDYNPRFVIQAQRKQNIIKEYYKK